MISAAGKWRHEGFPYALDNGAWSYYQQGESFNEERFWGLLYAMGPAADFITVPDIVAGGLESLRFSEAWLPKLEGFGRLLLIPVQDGMRPADVNGVLSNRVGIFVGGTTEFKLASLQSWGELARKRNCYLHVGRVNTRRRIKACAMAGAHSFDGSSVSRWAINIHKLDAERKQGVLDL